MKKLVENFGTQLKEAIQIGSEAKLSLSEKPYQNVLITGMGGSGIGGTIVSELIGGEIAVPIIVSKNYFLPAFVNENTLVIVSSYSGDTEETLKAMNTAMTRKAKVVCITSGGKVLEIAESNGINSIVIPGKMAPRACLGYSLVQLLFILNHFGIITDSFKNDLDNSIQLLNEEAENIQKEAKEVSQFLFNKLPVIYTGAGKEGLAIRFRQQLNENAKMLAWHGVIPEMNHNELVGWSEEHNNMAVLFFRDDVEYVRTAKRIDITKEVVSKHTQNIKEVYSKGESTIERALYLIHLGDWISVFLAEMRNVDPNSIEVINYLKSSLAEIAE